MQHMFLMVLILLFSLEMGGLILVGSWIGPIPVILYVICMGAFGIYLGKKEGLQTYHRMMQQFENEEPPGETILDGLCFLLSGLLLLIPGFLTDVVAFLLFIPFTRKWIRRWIIDWLIKKFANLRFEWRFRRH